MVEVAVLDLCGGKLPTEEGDKWVLGTGCSKTALSQIKSVKKETCINGVQTKNLFRNSQNIGRRQQMVGCSKHKPTVKIHQPKEVLEF